MNFDDFLIILVLGLSFIFVQLSMFYYSSVWNKHRGMFINFVAFSRGYVLIKGATFIIFWIFYLFILLIVFYLFPLAYMKNSNYLKVLGGLCLFKGLHLLFLPNVPGAMFIQGAAPIPNSRVWFEHPT